MPQSLAKFLDLYPENDNRTPFTSSHTHGGNQFLTFEGTPYVFCTACALGQSPDPRPVTTAEAEHWLLHSCAKCLSDPCACGPAIERGYPKNLRP